MHILHRKYVGTLLFDAESSNQKDLTKHRADTSFVLATPSSNLASYRVPQCDWFVGITAARGPDAGRLGKCVFSRLGERYSVDQRDQWIDLCHFVIQGSVTFLFFVSRPFSRISFLIEQKAEQPNCLRYLGYLIQGIMMDKVSNEQIRI